MNLFKFQDEIISTELFIDRLSPFIKKGDTVYAEMDVMKFGKLYDFQIKKDELLHQIFTIFYQLVGESGNILIPSFSYSWSTKEKGELFDVRNTKGKVGIFPEYFRKMEGTLRTLDPIFSVLAYGKDKENYVDIKNDSFGQGSIFHKMHDMNAKLVSFGLKQYDPTFVHYVEQYYDEHIEKLNYRELTEFSGEAIDYRGNRLQKKHYAFMRPLGSTIRFDDTLFSQDLKKQDLLGEVAIGSGKISISDCDAVFKVGIEGLKENQMYWAKHKPNKSEEDSVHACKI
jgi:aminoglycoside 3-N-acetyltransferase